VTEYDDDIIISVIDVIIICQYLGFGSIFYDAFSVTRLYNIDGRVISG
jgi:hypothetical protein